MRRKGGKLLREEYRAYTVTPGSRGTERKLLSVKGRYWKKGGYRQFAGEPVPEAGLLDIVLDDEADSSTRDGIDKELFPLTSDEQEKYSFRLVGERVVGQRSGYEIEFRPRDHSDYGWKGQALIDKTEFQPISIFTRLSRKLPLAVRTMLGTDVPGLGFNIEYSRVDKDLWFPASYGTEFEVRALFLLNRTFSESIENKNFRRASVDSRISFADNAAH